jgi:uncharacterized membrane protein
MYNFNLFLIILAIISPIAAYNRKLVLKDISIPQEVMFTSIFIIIVYGSYQLINNNKLIPTIKKESLKYLIFNAVLTCAALFMAGTILMNENVFKFKALQKSVYLIILIIIAVCLYKQKLTFKTILGLLFIIIGSYFIDITI